jgi:hypothetical protein
MGKRLRRPDPVDASLRQPPRPELVIAMRLLKAVGSELKLAQ